MALYKAAFCRNVIGGKGWDKGVVGYLQTAQEKLDKNFTDMDLENASVREEMEVIVNEMRKELDGLIREIEAVHFR